MLLCKLTIFAKHQAKKLSHLGSRGRPGPPSAPAGGASLAGRSPAPPFRRQPRGEWPPAGTRDTCRCSRAWPSRSAAGPSRRPTRRGLGDRQTDTQEDKKNSRETEAAPHGNDRQTWCFILSLIEKDETQTQGSLGEEKSNRKNASCRSSEACGVTPHGVPGVHGAWSCFRYMLDYSHAPL